MNQEKDTTSEEDTQGTHTHIRTHEGETENRISRRHPRHTVKLKPSKIVLRIVPRIQHIVKITFVVFIVPYRYSSTC